MKDIRIAFQGEPGAYSELAIIECFSPGVVTIPCSAFEDVFAAVSVNAGDETGFGMIPIENSLAGSIHRNYDLILRHELHIVGEYHLRVNHCLLALPGVEQKDVQRVHSHPQALAQCDANLTRMGVEKVAEADTAGSAQMIRARDDHYAAALASKRAAEVYGLAVLAENMEDNPENYTRFLVLSPEPQENDVLEGEDFKTSIVFSLHNEPGSLFKALSVFALRDIDLTKIESRPIQGQPWEYMFYVDFAGHIGTETCKRALDHLSEYAAFLRVLGSYPRHRFEK